MTYRAILLYIIGIINTSRGFNASAIARVYEKRPYKEEKVSHDLLTRLVKRVWDPQELLWEFVQTTYDLSKGVFIVDDTWTPKTYSEIVPFVSKQYSGKYKARLIGTGIVAILWTNGQIKIPVSIQIWRKGGKSKPQLALEMFAKLRNKKKLRRCTVLLDAGYAKGELLKRIHDYGWTFVCQVPKTRVLDGKKLFQFRKQGYWNDIGVAWFGKKVRAVRSKSKFYLCNRLRWNREEILETFCTRCDVEIAFRALKQEFGWVGCQYRSEEAYSHHLYLSSLSYISMQDACMKEFQGFSVYKLRYRAISQDSLFVPPLLERFFNVA